MPTARNTYPSCPRKAVEDGVASLAYVAGIHADTPRCVPKEGWDISASLRKFPVCIPAWMAGTSPAMTR
ncbi:MAG: hypothetical protein HYS06_08080 [Methylocystis sp.]|nr:hypothetical protein [Methylocystis sp.]